MGGYPYEKNEQAYHHYTMQHYNNKGNSGSMTAKVNDGLWVVNSNILNIFEVH
jgi:hypothetical protein